MKIAHSLMDLIGNTPLLRLERYEAANAVPAALLAKLECFNPLSSAKDRAARYMIEDAEARGLLKPGTVIVEPTSGNTGVGLSYIAAIKGYQVILTMPETMSLERRNLLSALGAKLELTPGALGMKGAIARAEELLRTLPSAWMPGQFDNPANATAHYETTGPEIWPAGATVSSGGKAGPHKIQGIGAGFVPAVLDRSVVDRVVTVPGDDAFAASRALAQTEGVLAGISSGAALSAAAALAKEEAYRGKNIVVVLPDTGERYLSTGLFQKSE